MLEAGVRLGPYEILTALGSGGMGEVYKARDTRLGRTVAVKVLPAHLSADPGLRARLEREARLVSRLSHPSICVLHDVGHQDGVDYLVMEYLEGETLSARLEGGPLPLDQALRLAGQVAEALDHAHRAGVVHRDLKPGNVMLTLSGAKLLDFGLAKLWSREGSDPSGLTEARTCSAPEPLTEEGMVVGTLPYMAPEQISGGAADTRTDIWALGAMLFEMVTGRRAFDEKGRGPLIASILQADPPSAASLAPQVPPGLDRVISVCLAREAEERWQSARDVALLLRDAGGVARLPVPREARTRGRERILWALGAALLCLAGVFAGRLRSPRAERDAVRFDVQLPDNAALYPFSGPVAISPDGRRLAFFARTEGRNVLYGRALDEPLARPLPGAENGTQAFWSPDSRSIGFFSEDRIRRLDRGGGAARDVCAAPRFGTAAWSEQGVILFGGFGMALAQVPATGGTPTPVTRLDASRQELAHLWPTFLPGGQRFLFLAVSARAGQTAIYAGTLGSTRIQRVLDAESNAVFTSGHLLFFRAGRLLAQRLDEATLDPIGDPSPVAENVWQFREGAFALFSASRNGTLAYATAGDPRTTLVWYGRNGQPLEEIPSQGAHVHVDVSADGSTVAFERLSPETSSGQVFLYDARRKVTSRLTERSQYELAPAFSPDGREVAFSAVESGGAEMALYRKAMSAAGDGEKLVEGGPALLMPTDWGGDGTSLIYEKTSPGPTREDLWALSLGGAQPKPFALLEGAAHETQGRLSSDGRWLAYTSNESGRQEVYVRPFSGPGGRWQISPAGGSQPRWRRDGKELFYLAPGDRLMAVTLSGGPAFEASAPARLFEVRPARFFNRTDYAVTADGERFLVNTRVEGATFPRISVVTGWRP